MNLGEFKKRIFLAIDEYDDGNSTWHTDDDDLINRFSSAFNEALRFVFYGKSEKQKWNIYQESMLNLVENTKEVYTHYNDAISFTVDEAKAYYFEVCDAATVTISDSTGVIKTITNPAVTDGEQMFNAYKGKIDAGGPVTISFEGEFFYRFRNVALYNINFSSEENIPVYSAWCEHPIPPNMYQVINVRYMDGIEDGYCDYKIEGNKILLPQGLLGRFEVESNFFPDEVTDETDNDTEISIPKDCIYPVIAKTAAILTQEGSEYSEHVADSEQYMQMLDDSRTKSRIRVIARCDF